MTFGVRYTFDGTHTGALGSIAPTLKRATMSGVTVARISNGKVAELWAHPDRLGWLQQLGVISAVYLATQEVVFGPLPSAYRSPLC